MGNLFPKLPLLMRDMDPIAPPPHRGEGGATIFGPYLLRPIGFVLDGDPAPLPKRVRSPKFSAHVYCGQTAGWIKTVVGTEVGLSPGEFMLDGAQPPLPKKGAKPLHNFRPISVVVKRLDASRCHLVWR